MKSSKVNTCNAILLNKLKPKSCKLKVYEKNIKSQWVDSNRIYL